MPSSSRKTFFGVSALVLLFLAVCASAAGHQSAQVHHPSNGTVIGIDLGTTYSCVAAYRNGRVEIISNDQGNKITPSYVAFTDSNERLVGESAKNQAAANPFNTIFDVKRLIGRDAGEKQVINDMKHWPFKVSKEDKSGKPMVQATVKGEEKMFSPEEVSAMILAKMKSIAEAYLGEPVVDAGT